MLKLWRWYQNCLAVHPVKTQMISSGFLWGVGDIGAQAITRSALRKPCQLTVNPLFFRFLSFLFFSFELFLWLFFGWILPVSSFNEGWDSSAWYILDSFLLPMRAYSFLEFLPTWFCSSAISFSKGKIDRKAVRVWSLDVQEKILIVYSKTEQFVV